MQGPSVEATHLKLAKAVTVVLNHTSKSPSVFRLVEMTSSLLLCPGFPVCWLMGK